MSEQDINTSGIVPTGGHLLVLPEKVEEMTAGGIYMPKTVQDKEQNFVTVGKLVAVGKSAWTDLDDGNPWAEVGDKVSYAKHAGFVMTGADGVDYILMNDNDVLARLLF